MAHFAELDENNIVLRVIVVNNSDCIKTSVKQEHPDILSSINSVSGKELTKGEAVIEWEDEAVGAAFCHNLLGGTWIQTSYNKNKRFNYAGKGYIYDKDLDAFYPPQPYKSWSLDKDCRWQPPVPYPIDGKMYRWDEETINWKVY